ncbi:MULTISPECIES: hypothetical protein [unclassified Bacteroides]|uniref:hypothetical protein n=1 Tax=unclassified Bacteroides TaxID=2646097 RepID=UPI004062BCCD
MKKIFIFLCLLLLSIQQLADEPVMFSLQTMPPERPLPDKQEYRSSFDALSCCKRDLLGENTLNHRGILQDKLYFCGMIKIKNISCR